MIKKYESNDEKKDVKKTHLKKSVDFTMLKIFVYKTTSSFQDFFVLAENLSLVAFYLEILLWRRGSNEEMFKIKI